jgi:hypothetical protein
LGGERPCEKSVARPIGERHLPSWVSAFAPTRAGGCLNGKPQEPLFDRFSPAIRQPPKRSLGLRWAIHNAHGVEDGGHFGLSYLSAFVAALFHLSL